MVVLCLGLDENLEGEEGDTGNSYASGDKKDLELPESQRELLEAVAGCGKPVVLCMMSGSAIDMQFAAEHVNAILQVWYPGARGGKAAAEILFGACSPSGKLPVTFYKDLEGFPAFEDYSMKGRTYRYLEKRTSVSLRLWPHLRTGRRESCRTDRCCGRGKRAYHKGNGGKQRKI